jgi:hypothetical protein
MKHTAEKDLSILEYNKFAKKIERSDFGLEIGKISAASQISDALSEEIRLIAKSEITKAYDKIWEGEITSLKNLPVESITPLLLLQQLGSVASVYTVNMDYLEYGFDPEMIFERLRKPSAKKQ